MTGLVYTNNAQSLLRSAIGENDTTLSVYENEGSLFPDISDDDNSWFPLTLINPDGKTSEIVRATSRDGDTITILRAQENTENPIAFPEGTIVSLRMSAAAFDEFVKSNTETFNILYGINLGVQTNDSHDPYEVYLEGITEYTEGLIVRFIPKVANPNRSTLKINVNGIESKFLTTTAKQPGSNAWLPGDFKVGVVHTIQYSEVEQRWYLISPPTLPNIAEQLVPGSVAAMLPGNEVYDPDGEPDAITGYPEFADRRSVSRIIDDYAATVGFSGGKAVSDDTLLSQIPALWTWYGDGELGDAVGNTSIQADMSYMRMYEKMELYSSGYIRTRDGNAIIRATESMELGCVIDPRQASTHLYPLQHYGPDGDTIGETNVPENTGSTVFVPRQDAVGTYQNDGSAAIRWTSLLNLMASGLDFRQLHGGHGGGYRDYRHASHLIYGRAAIMLVSPSIELTSTCKVNLSTRGANESQSSFNTDNLSEGQGTLPADTTQAGGGVLLLCAESVTIDDQAEFACSEGFGQDERTMFDIRANHYTDGTLNSDPFAKFRDAAPGIVLHFNPSDGTLVRLV